MFAHRKGQEFTPQLIQPRRLVGQQVSALSSPSASKLQFGFIAYGI
jgi:hypothetical protein